MLKYASVCAHNPSQIPIADRVNTWLVGHPNIKIIQANTFPLESEGSTYLLVWTVLYEEPEPMEDESSQETHAV